MQYNRGCKRRNRCGVADLSTVPVRGSTCTQLPDSADPQYTSAQQRPSRPRRERAHMEPASCLIRHIANETNTPRSPKRSKRA